MSASAERASMVEQYWLREIEARRNDLQAALDRLMPFVLEDYAPDMATPEYKAAVEAARALQSEGGA